MVTREPMGYGRSPVISVAGLRASDESELQQLAHEQAALRRVATLVGQGAAMETLLAVVAAQVADLLQAAFVSIVHYEADGTATERAGVSPQGVMFRVGTRWSLDGTSVMAQIRESGRPARIDDYGGLPGVIAETLRRVGIGSRVGIPIVVGGRVWGAMLVSSDKDPLPPDTEARLAGFTELVATAIANGEAREEVKRLADEQASLGRVATLVAEGSALTEVFAKAAEEVVKVLGDVDCTLWRDEGDRTASVVGAWGGRIAAGFPVGRREPLETDGVLALVLREGGPRRIDDYSATSATVAEGARERGIGSAAGCPIVVGGRVWGAMVLARREGAEPFPPETETRIAQFGDLVATAIANTETRAEVERLADEQTALRRVATLVAEGAEPRAVFDAVAAEMETLLDADGVMLSRYEPDDEVTVLARRGASAPLVSPGDRVSHEGEYVTTMVRRFARPARVEYDTASHGDVAERLRRRGLGASVGIPIVVDGRVWGVISASWNRDEPPPLDTEERMAEFAQLLDTAIANADSRDQLTASLVRLLTAADDARRRVVHDLHHGAEQRLAQTVVALNLARRDVRTDVRSASSRLAEALAHAERANDDLRELAHGILPSVLTVGGLPAAIRELVGRLDLPIVVDVARERFPTHIEASAYFIIAEALTNVLKHSDARRTEVAVSADARVLYLEVRDDGVGGADPAGHGLVGLNDRVNALGGRLTIESPPGGGTRLSATLPLG